MTAEEKLKQWYTCELTEDVGCGKPLKERSAQSCAKCPIYKRLGNRPNS